MKKLILNKIVNKYNINILISDEIWIIIKL